MVPPITTARASIAASGSRLRPSAAASRRGGTPTGLLRTTPPPPAPAPPPGDLALRHLRHHTNNMLQRLLAELATDGLQGTEPGRRLLEALQERIMASAAVTNALFAVTQAPASLERRLRGLCEGLRRLHAGSDQVVVIQVSAPPAPPPRHVGTLEGPMEVLVHVARELVENALRHGMHARSHGRIWVRLTGDGGRCALSVSDDGWGLGEDTPGPGLALVHDLIAPHGGRVEFSRQGDWTVARVVLDAARCAQGQ